MIVLPRADLHTHTHCSDGQLSPKALVHKAALSGITALAITDHDCVDGLAEARQAGIQHNVEIINGVELSVTVGETEVHLLGYFFDDEHPGLRAHLAAFMHQRRLRAIRMVEKIKALGCPLRFEAVERQAVGKAIGRPHVARALVAEGLVESYEDAFERYIGDGKPAFVAKPLVPAAEALALLHDAGGIGVLAHPGHWTADATLMLLIRAGLDGIEVVHPSHDDSLIRYYRQVACDFVLIETGGSDYHGTYPGSEPRLGYYTIPYALLERARRAASNVSIA